MLHCSLYIPLGLLVFFFSVSCCFIVLHGLKAIFKLVSLNRFEILLMMGLKYLNAIHFLLSCVLGSLYCILFAILVMIYPSGEVK